MTNPTNNAYTLDEEVTFIEFQLPGLVSGQYRLNLRQTLQDSAGKPLNDVDFAGDYTLAVLSDRFRLQSPAEIVFGTFPEDNGSGEYSNVLPHVVFTKRTFPWSREAQPNDKIQPGRATWLGVLLLDADDAGVVLTPQTVTVGDLFPKSAYSESSLPSSTLSYFRDATDTSGLELGELLTDSIQAIDLPLELFWKLAPTLEDLHYLAHTRRVSLLPKPTIKGVSDIGEPVGEFSIVFGNRMPQRQKKSCVYLVSLEEMGSLLPTDSGHPDPKGFTAIRLAVLAQWSFFSVGAPADFDDRLLALNGRTTGNTPPNAANTNLRLAYEGKNITVKNALSMGYVPLNQTLRTGEANVAWYRGPLAPYQVARGKVAVPVASPDRITAFDPTTGMLDASYAAAWSIGRLLALQDRGFSTGLYAWKRGLSAQVVQAVEDRLLSERFAALTALTARRAAARSASEAAEPAKSPLPAPAESAIREPSEENGPGDTVVSARTLRSVLMHTLLEAR